MKSATHDSFLRAFNLPPDPCPAELVGLGTGFEVVTVGADRRRFRLAAELYSVCPACGVCFVITRGMVVTFLCSPRKGPKRR